MASIDSYCTLIAETEDYARQHPRRYRLRLALLAAIGVGYVLVMALLALVLAVAIIAMMLMAHSVAFIKLAWIPLAFSFFLLRVLYVKLPPPEGRRLTRKNAPALFEEIRLVRSALHARKVHEVLLTNELNAAVAEVPRFGLFGGTRRYLVLGLPLLASLTPEQFRAVLAHEFGHLARNHAHFGNWIYRIRQVWFRLLTALEHRGGRMASAFTRFFRWYAPYFNAYSFVLARANEYEADRESARITGAAQAGEALVAVYTLAEYADARFWPSFFEPARESPEPPPAAFTAYVRQLSRLDLGEAEACLDAVLQRAADLNDTHPCLADRLAALGVDATPRRAVVRSAADVLLGEDFSTLLAETDHTWAQPVAQRWHEQFEYFRTARDTISRCATAVGTGGLPPEDLWDYARSLEITEGAAVALPFLDRLLAEHPDHLDARYARGRILLESGDEMGISDLERVMEADESAVEPAGELLLQFFLNRGKPECFEPYRQQIEALYQKRQLALAERRELGAGDNLEPHDLPEAELIRWREVLRGFSTVKKAWLVRKRVAHYPDDPFFVLMVEFRLFARVSQALLQQIIDSLPTQHARLLLHRSRHRRTYQKIRKIAGALVYGR